MTACATEILDECDLLFGERADFLTIDHEVTKKGIVPAQRHREQSAASAQLDKTAADRVARPISLVLCNICNMDNRLAAQQTPMRIIWADRMRSSCQKLCKSRRYAAKCGRMHLRIIIGPKDPEIGSA